MRIFNTHSVFDAVGKFMNVESTTMLEIAIRVDTDNSNQAVVVFEESAGDGYAGRSFLCESFETATALPQAGSNGTEIVCMKVCEIEPI